MGFLDSATGFISGTDWGETAETVGDVADDVGGIIDGGSGANTLPRRSPPILDPNPTPQPEPEPTDPEPDPRPRRGFAGMGQTTILMLGLVGAFIVTQT